MSTITSRKLAWCSCVVVALLLVAGACSSSKKAEPLSDDDAMTQVAQATVAAGSASYQGQTTFADGSSGPIEGTSQAAPPKGQVTYPVQTSSGPAPVTFVWVDTDFYVARAVTADADKVSTVLRLAEDKPWSRGTYQPVVAASFDAYDPFALVQRLALLGLQAKTDGDEQVDGTTLQRLTVDLGSMTNPPAGARTAELLVDDQHRLRHLRLLGDDTIEYSLADFGVDVEPSRPSDDQIGTSASRPPTSPVAPYEQVGTGSLPGGGTYRLLRAPASDDGTCWQVESDVPLDLVAPTQPDGATCISPLDPTDVADNQVAVVADAGAGAPFEFVVVAVAPGITDVDLQLADRSRHQLTVDPQGFVVWTGPKPPLALVMQITATDGEVVTCGPGSVTALDDLQSMPPDQIAALDRTAWLCLAL